MAEGNPLGVFSDTLVFLQDGNVVAGEDTVGINTLLLPAGSASAPSLTFTDAPDTGMFFAPGGGLGLSSGGRAALVVTPAGKLSVGGVDAASPETPLSLLHVHAREQEDAAEEDAPISSHALSLIATSGASCGLAFTSADGVYSGGLSLGDRVPDAALVFDATEGHLALRVRNPGDARCDTRMVITSDGMVGVNTRNPQHALHVEGNVFVSGNIVTPSGVIASVTDPSASATPLTDPGPRMALPFETFAAVAPPLFPELSQAVTKEGRRGKHVSLSQKRISRVVVYHRFTCPPPVPTATPTYLIKFRAEISGGQVFEEAAVQVPCTQVADVGAPWGRYDDSFPVHGLAHRWTLDGHAADVMNAGDRRWDLTSSTGRDVYDTSPPPPVGQSFVQLRKRTHVETMMEVPFQSRTAWTLSFWYRLDKVVFSGQFAGMIMRPKGVVTGSQTDATTNFDLFRQGGRLRLTGFVGQEAQFLSTEDGSITQGAWHHVCLQRSGDFLRLFRDGALVGQVASTNFVDTRISFPTSAGGDTDFFSLCDVCFFEAELSAEDVARLGTVADMQSGVSWGAVDLDQPLSVPPGATLSVEAALFAGGVTSEDHRFTNVADVLLFHEMRTGPLAASHPTHPNHAVNEAYVRTQLDRRWTLDEQSNTLTTPNSRVGIGVATPKATLHVAGDVIVGGRIFRDGDPFWWRPPNNPEDPGVDERKVVHAATYRFERMGDWTWRQASEFVLPHGIDLRGVVVTQRGRRHGGLRYDVRLTVDGGQQISFTANMSTALGQYTSPLYAALPPAGALLRRWPLANFQREGSSIDIVHDHAAVEGGALILARASFINRQPRTPPPVGRSTMRLLGDAHVFSEGIAGLDGNWTVMFWARLDAAQVDAQLTSPLLSLQDQDLLSIRAVRDGPFTFCTWVLGEDSVEAIPENEWLHIKVMRRQADLVLSVNGGSAGTFTRATALPALPAHNVSLAMRTTFGVMLSVLDVMVYGRDVADQEAMAFVSSIEPAVVTTSWGAGEVPEGSAMEALAAGSSVLVEVRDAGLNERDDAMELETVTVEVVHSDTRIFGKDSLNPNLHHTVTTGSLTVPEPTHPAHAATKAYVDAKSEFAGGLTVRAQDGKDVTVDAQGNVVVRADLEVHGTITQSGEPELPSHAATKAYVDAKVQQMTMFEPNRVLVSDDQGVLSASNVHAQDLNILDGILSDHPPPPNAVLFLSGDGKMYGFPWFRVEEAGFELPAPSLTVQLPDGHSPAIRLRADGVVDVQGSVDVREKLEVRGRLEVSTLDCRQSLIRVNPTRDPAGEAEGIGVRFATASEADPSWTLAYDPGSMRLALKRRGGGEGAADFDLATVSQDSQQNRLAYVGPDRVLRSAKNIQVIGDGTVKFTGDVLANAPTQPNHVAIRQWCEDLIGATWEKREGGHAVFTSGRVGIGLPSHVAAPAFDLDVRGDINFTGTLFKDGHPYAPHGWSMSPQGIAYTTERVSIGGSMPPPGWDLFVQGSAFFRAGASIVVQGGVNGGPNRGLRLWSQDDTSWGIYMASANGLTMAGAPSPCAGAEGVTGLAARFRCPAGAGNGFIFENDADECNMSIRGSDGMVCVRGRLGVGVEDPQQTLHVAGHAHVTGDVVYTGRLFRGEVEVNLEEVEHVDSFWESGEGGAVWYNEGNVGIGTANPQHNLHVHSAVGDATVQVSSSGSAMFRITSGASDTPSLVLTDGVGSSASLGVVAVQDTAPHTNTPLPNASPGDFVLRHHSVSRSTHIASGGTIVASFASHQTTLRNNVVVQGDLRVSGSVILARPAGDINLESLVPSYDTLAPAPAADRGKLLAFDAHGVISTLQFASWDAPSNSLEISSGASLRIKTALAEDIVFSAADASVNTPGSMVVGSDLEVSGDVTVGGNLNVTGNVIFSSPPSVPHPVLDTDAVPKAYLLDVLNHTQNAWLSDGQNVMAAAGTNVGIGTNNPQAKLHVVGDVLVDGVLEAPEVSLGGGTATWSVDGEGGVTLRTAGTAKARWAPSEVTQFGSVNIVHTPQNAGLVSEHEARGLPAGSTPAIRSAVSSSPPAASMVVATHGTLNEIVISADGGETWSSGIVASHTDEPAGDAPAIASNISFCPSLQMFAAVLQHQTDPANPANLFSSGESNRLQIIAAQDPVTWTRSDVELQGGQGVPENPNFGILREVDRMLPRVGGGFAIFGASSFPDSNPRVVGYETADTTSWTPVRLAVPQGDSTEYRLRHASGDVALHNPDPAPLTTTTVGFVRAAHAPHDPWTRIDLPTAVTCVSRTGPDAYICMRRHDMFIETADRGAHWAVAGNPDSLEPANVADVIHFDSIDVTVALGRGVWARSGGPGTLFSTVVPEAPGDMWMHATFDAASRVFSFFNVDGRCAFSNPVADTAELVVGGNATVVGDLQVQGEVLTLSDDRAKQNVRPISGALDMVRKMRGVRYTMQGESRLGFVAQELMEVVPEAVRARPDGFLAVSYSSVVALLSQAVNELALAIEA